MMMGKLALSLYVGRMTEYLFMLELLEIMFSMSTVTFVCAWYWLYYQSPFASRAYQLITPLVCTTIPSSTMLFEDFVQSGTSAGSRCREYHYAPIARVLRHPHYHVVPALTDLDQFLAANKSSVAHLMTKYYAIAGHPQATLSCM